MVQEKPHIEVEQALLPHFHDFFIAPLNQKEPSSVAKSSLESLKVLFLFSILDSFLKKKNQQITLQ